MKRFLSGAGLLCTTTILFSQSIVQPNYGLKSHETLEINKIEMTGESTLIYLTVENRIKSGYFCADKNIFIVYPDGKKSKLISSSGIPVCPEKYFFRSAGEKLYFTLTFPALKSGTGWIDLVEECSENCFYFYGVTLDTGLNKLLDDIFSRASKGKPSDNVVLFKTVIDSIGSLDHGIEGLLYINIVNAALEDADNVNASVWYRRLASSNAPRAGMYIKFLNDKGIKF